MPATKHVLVLGAGAAGSSAAQVLAQHEDIATTAIAATETAPYNRTLVNKAVATGLIDAKQAHLPLLPTTTIRDSAEVIFPKHQHVELRSGTQLDYDAVIVATGSTPRPLPAGIAGPGTLESGLLTHLHSLDDALRVRAVIEQTPAARVLIYGAGFIGAETAGILNHAGCEVTLAAASKLPGVTVFGSQIAEQLARAHHDAVDTHFGHALTALERTDRGLYAVFDDGRDLTADLVITALGTLPLSPAPWSGPIHVDSRLRSREHAKSYAAGGVAVHEHAGAAWRIDHWDDALAQGAHAARSVLFDLGLKEDPGPYRPRALYSAQIQDHLYFVAGHTSPLGTPRTLTTSPLVLAHEDAGRLLAVAGLDAAAEVMDLVPQLHAPTVDVAHSRNSPSTDTPWGYTVRA